MAVKVQVRNDLFLDILSFIDKNNYNKVTGFGTITLKSKEKNKDLSISQIKSKGVLQGICNVKKGNEEIKIPISKKVSDKLIKEAEFEKIVAERRNSKDLSKEKVELKQNV